MRRLLGKLTGLFAILVFLLISQLATTNVVAGNLIVDEIGVLNGVPYKIRVPEDWNKILLIYAHGYSRSDPPTLVPMQIEILDIPVEEGLLAQGYALAASSYSNNGWAVKEGIKDTKNLMKYFKKHIEKPDLTILWGSSMGSVITLKSIEKYPNTYDGAIVLSHLGAGTTSTFDMTLAIALAYHVTLGWPEEWGSVGDVRDDLDFETEVAPILTAQVYDLSDPSNPTLNLTNFGKFEFLRLVNHLPLDGFYDGVVPLKQWLFGDMHFATSARAELENRAGGPVAQNLNHTYTLSDDDKDDLALIGVNAEALLSEMNQQTVFEADSSARNYLKKYADFGGELERPVLTIQPIGDGMAVPANSTVYQGTVEAASASDLLLQKYTNGNMHAVFTPAQVYAAFEAMVSWLETGNRPSDPSFWEHPDPNVDWGFDNSYVPPDWPQPTTK